MGAVEIEVASDVLESKYPGKPPYVGLKIDGEDYNYTTENDECAAFFDGLKGQTLTVVASGGGRGKEDTARVELAGDAPTPKAKATPAAKSTQPAAKSPAAAKPAAKAPHPQLGVRVGMCIQKAVDYCIGEGIPYCTTEIYNRASDLIRISEHLEAGKLAPTYKERHPEAK